MFNKVWRYFLSKGLKEGQPDFPNSFASLCFNENKAYYSLV